MDWATQHLRLNMVMPRFLLLKVFSPYSTGYLCAVELIDFLLSSFI